MTVIKCDVENCIHNEGYRCQVEKLDIDMNGNCTDIDTDEQG